MNSYTSEVLWTVPVVYPKPDLLFAPFNRQTFAQPSFQLDRSHHNQPTRERGHRKRQEDAGDSEISFCDSRENLIFFLSDARIEDKTACSSFRWCQAHQRAPHNFERFFSHQNSEPSSSVQPQILDKFPSAGRKFPISNTVY